MLAMIDADVEALREQREDDTYRWASLQREEASRVKDEKAIERVQTEKELREVTLSAPNAYRVEVRVPTKRTWSLRTIASTSATSWSTPPVSTARPSITRSRSTPG